VFIHLCNSLISGDVRITRGTSLLTKWLRQHLVEEHARQPWAAGPPWVGWLHLLGRGRLHLLGRGWLHLSGWGRRHLLGIGRWGRRHLLGLGGRGWRYLLPPLLLGFTSWWPEMVVLGFSWCHDWRSSWTDRTYIDNAAHCQVTGHALRNPCPHWRALGHKKSHVVTRRCVTVHILFKIPMTNYSYELFDSWKNYELFVFFINF
jgi:hypothetical protein